MILRKVPIECSDKGPIISQFFFAQFDWVNGDVYPQLSHCVLNDFEVNGVFIGAFGVSDDTIGKDSPREIVIDNPTIDSSLAQLFNPDAVGDITEKRMDPGGDGLSGDGGLVVDGFVHKKFVDLSVNIMIRYTII